MAIHRRRPGESVAAERKRLGRTTSARKRATGRGRVSPPTRRAAVGRKRRPNTRTLESSASGTTIRRRGALRPLARTAPISRAAPPVEGPRVTPPPPDSPRPRRGRVTPPTRRVPVGRGRVRPVRRTPVRRGRIRREVRWLLHPASLSSSS